MSAITHHTPEAMLASYAAGSLPQPFAIVVAAHVSMCMTCRASLGAHQAAGGVLLDTCGHEPVSDTLKSQIWDQLDAPVVPRPTFRATDIYPGPIMEALKGKPPQWKSLGMGVKQSILSADKTGSTRLLYIPSGQAVPDHTHNGLELTLVLQGSFSDQTGQFRSGDLEVADQALEHTPIADAGLPCICIAATDAPLRFSSLIPRMLQPLFGI